MTENKEEMVDFRELVRNDPALEAGQTATLEQELGGSNYPALQHELQELQAEIDSGEESSPGMLTRAGIVWFLVGRQKKAIENLSQVKGSAAASFYLAMALSSTNRHAEAKAEFDEAAKNGYDRIECTLLRAGEARAQGHVDEAEAILKEIASEAVRRAEYSYQM
ncbi:MAG: hypothetical protein IID45_13360, partial [Planctomycetes bacterium]|nr:hypothetical protein [Planctomycetota bacterium]